MSEQPRLAGGLGALERWSVDASQAERNAVYEALFAVLEGTLDDRYAIARDGDRFRVLVTGDLVLHGRLRRGAFDVVFIGRPRNENDAAA